MHPRRLAPVSGNAESVGTGSRPGEPWRCCRWEPLEDVGGGALTTDERTGPDATPPGPGNAGALMPRKQDQGSDLPAPVRDGFELPTSTPGLPGDPDAHGKAATATAPQVPGENRAYLRLRAHAPDPQLHTHTIPDPTAHSPGSGHAFRPDCEGQRWVGRPPNAIPGGRPAPGSPSGPSSTGRSGDCDGIRRWSPAASWSRTGFASRGKCSSSGTASNRRSRAGSVHEWSSPARAPGCFSPRRPGRGDPASPAPSGA